MSRRRPRRGFRSLPLALKVLIPFATLLLVIGSLGGFLIVHDLSSRAQAAVDQVLLGRSLDARSFVRDRELYLLESVNLAANLEGMDRAVARADADAVSGLLDTVLALKTDVDSLVVTDWRGVALAEIVRADQGEQRTVVAGRRWSDRAPIKLVLRGSGGEKVAAFARIDGRMMMTIASPICRAGPRCEPVGAAMVGIGLEGVTAGLIMSQGTTGQSAGATLYDLAGHPLARSGLPTTVVERSELAGGALHRVNESVGARRLATLFAPLKLGGRRAGTLAMTVPTDNAFSSVRGAAVRLGLILLVAMAGIVAIGSLLSRYILRQLRPLVSTNRALGRGELSARAPVLAEDELGEVARGLNQMAEQLEASVDNLEQRVAERTEEVQRLLSERTEFFASISHEFRTPLAVILRHAEMLGDPTYQKTQRWNREASATLKGSGVQLLGLINDILELAKAEAGRIDIDLEPLRLHDLLEEMKPTIKGLAKGSSLRVGISAPKDLTVTADRVRLRQVLLNLVDNAVKYTPQGGRISVEAAAVNGHVEIAVSDTGVGIPRDAGARVFDPFYRVQGTKTQRGQASSGLGLALAKRFVEAQGGAIDFSSEPGEGSTFRVSLQRAGAPAR